MYKELSPDFRFEDSRGTLVQLIHHGYTQVNVIVTKRGKNRGGHYHKYCREAFFVISGSVDVTMSKDQVEKQVHFSAGMFFEIAPFTIHSMTYPEDCVMLALYDIPVENSVGEKDIYAV